MGLATAHWVGILTEMYVILFMELLGKMVLRYLPPPRLRVQIFVKIFLWVPGTLNFHANFLNHKPILRGHIKIS